MPVLENALNVRESQGETPSFLLIGIFCVVHLLSALLGPINVFEGELLDTDSYTRLNRVLFVHEQGHWNNSIYPRSNAPFGESIHWTKPMDILLLAGGALLALIMPFSAGLHVWGVVISPLLHVVAFMGIFYLMREALDRQGMIVLAIAFLLQPILSGYFMIGRPDHHSLILAIFCWFLVGLYKLPSKTLQLRQFIFLGGMGALGLWVSLEFLVPISLFLMAYTIFWVWEGEEQASYISGTMNAMFLVATVFLLFERSGDDLFSIEYDKISLAHCAFLALIAMVWFGISKLGPCSRGTSTVWRRMVVIGSGSLMASWVQWYFFPGFFEGPLVGIDPSIRQLLWDKVAETQSLQISEAIMNLGMGILVLPCLVYGMWRKNWILSKYQGLVLFVGAVIFIPLALYESRWTPYASIILLIPFVEYVRRALEWVGKRWPNRSGEAASLLVGLVLLFGPITVGTVMAREEPKLELSTMDGKCPLKPLGEYLTTHESWAGTSHTILAFQDFGPELLYRTSHKIIGTPMHRNQAGFIDTLAVMKAVDMPVAQEIVQRRDIDLILICVSSAVEADFFWDSSSEKTLYRRLSNGKRPKWIRKIELPNDLNESFRLFGVIKKKV